jgi:hypothetical protein
MIRSEGFEPIFPTPRRLEIMANLILISTGVDTILDQLINLKNFCLSRPGADGIGSHGVLFTFLTDTHPDFTARTPDTAHRPWIKTLACAVGELLFSVFIKQSYLLES